MLGWWRSPKVLIIRYAIGGISFCLLGLASFVGFNDQEFREAEIDTIEYRKRALYSAVTWLNDTFGQTTTGIVAIALGTICIWRATVIYRTRLDY